MKKFYDAIIIGSGAAAYGVADWLIRDNITNIAIVTENRFSGTSRNTGSDKQTYYKLSMDGCSDDSPYKMATDVFASGSCDGEKMYLQAVNSIPCFLRLCEYGVGFPKDEFGGYPGYKTDHDNTRRATSIGPLTSRVMTEKLEAAVISNSCVDYYDNSQVVEILTSKNKVNGITALDTNTNQLKCLYGKNVVCATGAPACIYENSVYPKSQHGMTGVLLNAGVRLCNYSQWQYGLSSVDFRWNVSGSFMQVVPRFISVDENGNETEFLNNYFSFNELFDNVFLKGYQWPFSFNRITKSSKIDVAVHNETKKGNKVYLDFSENPQGFSFDLLGEEAKSYLSDNNAFGNTPIERLEKLNSKAIEIYKNNNIDLYNQKLRIAVCAQHNNGGVYTDNNYQTDVKGLYVIGEAAGTFGLARPGGTALNDTQVGGFLCAKHIKKNLGGITVTEIKSSLLQKLKDFKIDNSVDYSFVKTKMSNSASFIRNKEECEALLSEINGLIKNYPVCHKSLSDYFYDYDMLLSAKALLETIVVEMVLTGSRGGAVFLENGNEVSENKDYRNYLTVTENGIVTFEKVRAVPKYNKPFEQYLSQI